MLQDTLLYQCRKAEKLPTVPNQSTTKQTPLSIPGMRNCKFLLTRLRLLFQTRRKNNSRTDGQQTG